MAIKREQLTEEQRKILDEVDAKFTRLKGAREALNGIL
jgi:hypothetical protein